mmetsp:Transcript_13930/g.28527  ORF Transcript_13930/g.28527 Transcript_13930/m.28527 type:complete len:220 (+) Transcript_13930:300-959(+)
METGKYSLYFTVLVLRQTYRAQLVRAGEMNMGTVIYAGRNCVNLLLRKSAGPSKCGKKLFKLLKSLEGEFTSPITGTRSWYQESDCGTGALNHYNHRSLKFPSCHVCAHVQRLGVFPCGQLQEPRASTFMSLMRVLRSQTLHKTTHHGTQEVIKHFVHPVMILIGKIPCFCGGSGTCLTQEHTRVTAVGETKALNKSQSRSTILVRCSKAQDGSQHLIH